jgi:hypothetical protein
MSRTIATALALTLAIFAIPAFAGVTCTPVVLPTSAQLVDSDIGAPFWIYSLLGDGTTDLGFGGPDPDKIQVEFYYNNLTGTFDLGAGDDTNYATCAHCVLIVQDIQGGSADKLFYQSAGAMTLATSPGPAQLDIELSGVTLIEVTIDPNSFESVPVPGGACYVQVTDEIFGNGFDGPIGRAAAKM